MLTLCSDPGLPRKIVQLVIDYLQSFIRNIYVPFLKKDIANILRDANILTESLKEINDKCFETYSTIFDALDTEAKRFSILKSRGFIDSQEFVIGSCYENTVVNNREVFVFKSLYGILRDTRSVYSNNRVHCKTVSRNEYYYKYYSGQFMEIKICFQG